MKRQTCTCTCRCGRETRGTQLVGGARRVICGPCGRGEHRPAERPSDGATTARVHALVESRVPAVAIVGDPRIRQPWTDAAGMCNLLTLGPAPAVQVVGFLMGVSGGDGTGEEPAEEPVPSRTRPAAPANPRPSPRPAVEAPRRGLVRRFADRLGQTIDLYRQRVRRHLAEGGAGSRRGSWEGQG